MKILKDKITATQASELEKKYCYQYKSEGWNMINTESGLGNLGGHQDDAWTEEKIRIFLKEHPEINSRKKLEQHNRSMYMAAKDLNLLDDLFGEKQHKTWKKAYLCNLSHLQT